MGEASKGTTMKDWIKEHGGLLGLVAPISVVLVGSMSWGLWLLVSILQEVRETNAELRNFREELRTEIRDNRDEIRDNNDAINDLR